MRAIRDCSVAVVGGAGFLGSHLVNHLVDDRGCRVVVLDNLVAGRREFVHPKAAFEHCDIAGSEDYLRGLFNQYAVEYVFNYAAYPYVPTSVQRPIHVCNVNYFGAMKVVNAAQEAGAKGILQVSSAEIYGKGQSGFGGSINEDAPVEPHSSYGVSKAAVDAWVRVRWREAKTPCIALRQFNCVGERETHPYVVPEIVSQLTPGKRAKAVGKEHHVHLGNNSFRDFMYAGDAVRIAVKLLERGQFGEVYNLGSEDGLKVYDLAKTIGKLMGFADVTVEVDESRKRPWEIWHLQSNNSKIKQVLKPCQIMFGGEFSLVPLEDALRRTIADYESRGRRWAWER